MLFYFGTTLSLLIFDFINDIKTTFLWGKSSPMPYWLSTIKISLQIIQFDSNVNASRLNPRKSSKSLVFYYIEISQRILPWRLMSNWPASGAMWSKSSGLIVIPGNNAERHNVEPWRTYPPNPMSCVYGILLPSPGNDHLSPSDPSQLGIAV